jgi:hypothetical protein
MTGGGVETSCPPSVLAFLEQGIASIRSGNSLVNGA